MEILLQLTFIWLGSKRWIDIDKECTVINYRGYELYDSSTMWRKIKVTVRHSFYGCRREVRSLVLWTDLWVERETKSWKLLSSLVILLWVLVQTLMSWNVKRVNDVMWWRFTYDRIYYNDFLGHENFISERAKTELFHSALFNVV